MMQVPVEPRLAADGRVDSGQTLPRRHEPDLASLAAFTLDARGQVTAWSATATALFGLPAQAAVGHDICDILMTGPGQADLVRHALAEVGAGRVWTATVAGGQLGEGRFSVRWESLAGPDGGVLVIAVRAWPQPRPSWLSEAAARIGNTLDLAQTAAEAAEAAVPGFADAAVIYTAERLLVADELAAVRHGQATAVRRLAARQAAWPHAADKGLAGVGEPLVFAPDTPGARAMAAGLPVLFDEREAGSVGGWLERSAASYLSFLAMPLAARGTVIGCAIFARGPASPPFNDGDISLAAELASRTAICIDNARLYDRERRTALALQRGLLPAHSQVPPGLEVAHRYLPVGDSVVGGDWHDIIPVSGGRAVLVVGDAMGHGPEAAAVMVQLRTAARTLADLELPAERVLPKLDKMAAGMAMAPFATCVYAVVDPAAGSCVIARAGHLPPVLTLPDGSTQVLELPAGLPLGLSAESFETTQVELPPGATLALFTDGLVESRSRPIDRGLAALREALSAALADPSVTLDDACAQVTRALSTQGEDDITLVLARIR